MIIRLICVLLVSLPLHATELVAITKQHTDQREYQGLVLANGLKVLLISDPSLEKSAAIVDVKVGSFAEPDSRPGLAHLLEHMLDTGTEKHPKSDDFTNFIAKHGGDYNAMTDSQYTRYLASIDTNYLEPLLERFAEFFISPLFVADLIERERNAIESEYRLNIKDDYYRLDAVMHYTSNIKHPFHRFDMGSLATLSDLKDNSAIRQDLINFYKNYYTPENMSLVIVGPQKITQLQDWVIKYFAAIAQRHSQIVNPTELALDQEFAQDLQVKSISEKRELNLLFKLKNLQANDKALRFIINLLQQTGNGSLYNYLINNNLSTGYEVTHEEVTAIQDVLKINIKLTANGQNHVEDITGATLQYIKFLSEHLVDNDAINEFKKINILQNKFKPGKSAIMLAASYDKKLHNLPLSSIIVADDFTQDTTLDVSEIKELLAELNAKNMRRIYLHKNVNSKTIEPWYKVNYILSAYSNAQLNAWNQPIKYTFAKQEPNNLLPENLKIYQVSGNIITPGLIFQSQQLQVWHKQDNRFKEPKVCIKLLFHGINTNDSVENALNLHAVTYLINENLELYRSKFALAGITYSVNPNPQGLVVELSMFSDKIKEVLEIVANNLINVNLKDECFESVKQMLKAEFADQRSNPLFVQAMNSLFQVINQPSYSPTKKLEKLETLSANNVKEYWQTFIARTKVTALIVGNITDVQAISAAKFLASKVNSTPLENATYAKMPKLVEYQANDRYGLELTTEHHDHAIASYFQTNETGKLLTIKMLLINSMLSSALYTQLRVQEQLGYVIFAHPYTIKEHPGIIFVIESPVANPVVLNTKLHNFFQFYQTQLDEMTNHQFEDYKDSLKRNLLAKPSSMAEDAKYSWSKIIDGSHDFNSKKELAAKLAAIKLQDMRNFYKNFLLTNKKSANVLVYTKINQKNIAEDYIPLNER